MRLRVSTTALVLASVTVASLTACSSGTRQAGSGSGSGSGSTINVVASTNVYGGLVSTIGGKHVNVTSILSNPSQDPHSFESSSRTQLAVSKADILIENGGGYDDYMDTLRSSSNTKADLINVVNLSGLKKPGATDFNEHVFYSYPTMVTFVDKITAALSAKDKGDAGTFTANATAIKGKLSKLESETAALKVKFSGEKVAYTEPVPGYLFDAVGLVNVAPPAFSEAIEEGNDVPPAAMNDTLALFTGSDKIKMLAYNNQTSSPETEQVKKAANAGDVPVVGVTETLPTGKNYITWQQSNIDAIQAALSK